MITLYDEVVAMLFGIGLEDSLAKELVNELVRVELDDIKVETWMVSLDSLKDRARLMTGVWLRIELVAVDFFAIEAPTHPARELFRRKPHTMRVR